MRTPRTVVVTLRRLGDHLSPALRRSPPFRPFPSAADGSILAPLVSYASCLPHASSSREEDRSQEVEPGRLDLLVFRSSSSARPPRIDSPLHDCYQLKKRVFWLKGLHVKTEAESEELTIGFMSVFTADVKPRTNTTAKYRCMEATKYWIMDEHRGSLG
ncbi:hypothetical protein B296_00036971 [Ensete ventricosum]|uniref:Uncharacterized protein n=1 Tax=Ensete ventricosum TaxID=4639 RepID=A0A426YL67_ENSVE|nr:hypothetical protein B296_00036971 [Ensete ventricosum]